MEREREVNECDRDCGSCSTSCENRTVGKGGFLGVLNPTSPVEKVIGVVSGKGGVGKSLVTSMMAVSMNRKGKKIAVLDTNTTGSPIPMIFGFPNDGVMTSPDSKLMPPARSMEGVKIISANLLLDKGADPVIWRDPVIAGIVKQSRSETLWQGIDYMFVDMPPGTGDVPLTVFQSLPVDGVIIVAPPQELVGIIMVEVMNMARRMDIPVVGAVGNMGYLKCPDCGKRISVLGEGHVEEVAKEHGIQVLAQIPIDPKTAQMMDAGRVEHMEIPWFKHAAEVAEAL